MRRKSSLEYLLKVQEKITLDEFQLIEYGLLNIPDTHLEALWNLLEEGYPMNFAVQNYINLYELVRDNSLDYTTALNTLYSISLGVNESVVLKEILWFELN